MEQLPADWKTLGDTVPLEPARAARASDSGPIEPRRRGPWMLAAALLISGAAALLAIALVAWSADPSEVVLTGTDVTGSLRPEGSPPDWSASPSPAEELVVDVEGGVVRPGVHRLAASSRVGDAIAAAGGYAPRVDASAAALTLNLAAPLTDGEKIHVPVLGEGGPVPSAPPTPGPAAGTPSGAGPVTGPIDLNHADGPTLETLPGIGPVTAGEIIAARAVAPFTSIDDLRSRGIVGPVTMEQIRPLVTVGG